MPRQRAASDSSTKPPERASRARQRQRLIDACISALHIHGPSRTTVEKVVALADMSPGIVRFYFDSKDAMLVASLAYLASEFEERVMQPVARMKGEPVQALERLVDLYLDAQIASPRKVSVWYSFWGEASSRQEYQEICGRKDEDFAALVRELIEAMIARSGHAHLDAEAVALGLIGVLEILWQSFAFVDESRIDRAAARSRSIAYLRSVFPGYFGARPSARAPVADGLPAWAYADSSLLKLERDRLLRPSWQLVGHEADIPGPGDYLTAEIAGERVLVVRATDTRIQAFRNSCRKRPHALLMSPRGNLDSIRCGIHGLVYGLDGRLESGDTPGDLTPLELALPGRFMLVRAAAAMNAEPVSSALLSIAGAPSGHWESLPEFRPAGSSEIGVAADWKLMVEQWLDAVPPPKGMQRTFLAPNQLLEMGSAEATILQVIPEAPGRCRIRRLDYRSRKKRAGGPLRALDWLVQDIEVAESTQAALAAGLEDALPAGAASAELEAFRRGIRALLPDVSQANRSGA
jgi:TetR/AcrR family transcriptional repressor of bet genes